jgi:hypothetical protein
MAQLETYDRVAAAFGWSRRRSAGRARFGSGWIPKKRPVEVPGGLNEDGSLE